MGGVASDRVVDKVAAVQHFGHGPLAKLAAVEMRGIWLQQSFGSKCLRGKHGRYRRLKQTPHSQMSSIFW